MAIPTNVSERLFVGGIWDGQIKCDLGGAVIPVRWYDKDYWQHEDIYIRQHFVLEGLGDVEVLVLQGLTVEPDEVAQRLAGCQMADTGE